MDTNVTITATVSNELTPDELQTFQEGFQHENFETLDNNLQMKLIALFVYSSLENVEVRFDQVKSKPSSQMPTRPTDESQRALVLKLLMEGRSLTRLTAMHYNIMNVTARIAELREEGWRISCERKRDENGKTYGSWSLAA